MKDRVLIYMNSYEGPGIYKDILDEKEIKYALVLHYEDIKKYSPMDYGAIIVLGGPGSVNDEDDRTLLLLKSMHDSIKENIPVLGICLGCQALAKVSGGKITKGVIPEIGIRDHSGNYFEVSLTEEGIDDPLFTTVAPNFKVFELHNEVIELNDNISLLGKGSIVSNQIIKVSPLAYGLLFHLEIKLEDLKEWMQKDDSFSEIDKEQLLADYQLLMIGYHKTARQLFINFLSIANLI